MLERFPPVPREHLVYIFFFPHSIYCHVVVFRHVDITEESPSATLSYSLHPLTLTLGPSYAVHAAFLPRQNY